MTVPDLPDVTAVATAVHPAFPEDEAVFAERLQLYPQGCHVLMQDGAVVGYILSHPWHDDAPPALNTLLGALPASSNVYYVHDLALIPAARASGAGADIMRKLIARAREAGFATMALVAVNESSPFWRRQGFQPATGGKLASYGDDAQYMTLPLR